MSTVPQVSLYHINRYTDDLHGERLPNSAILVGRKIVTGLRLDWGYCCYKQSQLAEWLGLSRQTIITAIGLLEERGLLKVVREWGRGYKRNRYIPLLNGVPIGQELEDDPPLREPRQYRVDHAVEAQETSPTVSNPLDIVDVKPALHSSTEEDSFQESSPSYKTTKEPTARRDASLPRRAGAIASAQVRNWTTFEEMVLATWRVPKGWDSQAFSRSLERFTKTMTTAYRSNWIGTEKAISKLKGWLRGEWYKTEEAYFYRGLQDFSRVYEG